jgi:hypothetical protein
MERCRVRLEMALERLNEGALGLLEGEAQEVPAPLSSYLQTSPIDVAACCEP